MKRKKITILAITFLAIGLMTAGCKLSAPVTIDENGMFTIHEITVEAKQQEE